MDHEGSRLSAVASGIGVLIIGDSGMGKTTAALCLAEEKGGAWVADDAVDLSRRGDAIRGRSPAIIRGLVAVRGRGIVRASGLVSRMRIRKKAPVDGVVRLVRRAEERDAAWPGIVKQGEACRILGVERPFCALIVGEGEPVYRRIAGWAARSFGREGVMTRPRVIIVTGLSGSGKKHGQEGAGGHRLLLRRQPAVVLLPDFLEIQAVEQKK